MTKPDSSNRTKHPVDHAFGAPETSRTATVQRHGALSRARCRVASIRIRLKDPAVIHKTRFRYLTRGFGPTRSGAGRDLPGVTQAQCDEAATKVNSAGGPLKARSDWPVPGLVAHITGPSPNGWFVADVWDSEESFGKFGEILLPILRDVGFPDVQPRVLPAYNVVTA